MYTPSHDLFVPGAKDNDERKPKLSDVVVGRGKVVFKERKRE
jgi:hypothetical protein